MKLLPFSFSTRKRLKPGCYDPQRRRWVFADPADPGEYSDIASITCVTFNVWFGEHHFEERCLALLSLLEQRRPDIIALQEVTPPFLAGIRAASWIQRDFFISDFLGSTLSSYGVVLLSRFPFESLETHALPSRMHRKLLLARIPVNGIHLSVGTVHLESLIESAPYRGRQLEQIFKTVKRDRDVLLMGDFNFCSSWTEEQNRIEPGYLDAWAALHSDPGYTEDPAVNSMLREMSDKEAVRFDRVLLRSGTPGWVPVSSEVLGMAPISESLPDVFPSDHFGVLTRLNWRA